MDYNLPILKHSQGYCRCNDCVMIYFDLLLMKRKERKLGIAGDLIIPYYKSWS